SSAVRWPTRSASAATGPTWIPLPATGSRWTGRSYRPLWTFDGTPGPRPCGCCWTPEACARAGTSTPSWRAATSSPRTPFALRPPAAPTQHAVGRGRVGGETPRLARGAPPRPAAHLGVPAVRRPRRAGRGDPARPAGRRAGPVPADPDLVGAAAFLRLPRPAA